MWTCFVNRSEVVSPTQWAERAEQKARERIQPLMDEAQVGGCKCYLGSARVYFPCKLNCVLCMCVFLPVFFTTADSVQEQNQVLAKESAVGAGCREGEVGLAKEYSFQSVLCTQFCIMAIIEQQELNNCRA